MIKLKKSDFPVIKAMAVLSAIAYILFSLISCVLSKNDPYESIKKKNIMDYNDADMERLFDQWEVRFI